MSGWNFRKTLGLLGGLVRLTATRRGVAASVGRGPLRVGRGADGRYRATVRVGPLYKTVPLGRPRARASEGAYRSPVMCGCGHHERGTAPYTACRRRGCACIRSEGAWPAPEGAPLPPSTRPLVAAERCATLGCGHGPGYHNGNPPGTEPYTRCWYAGCGCVRWVSPGAWPPPSVVAGADHRTGLGVTRPERPHG